MNQTAVKTALTIAGSDSGGGAGIQADLKAFARVGVHGMSAITAITAQNTVGVTAIHPIPPDVIVAQVEAVSSDIGVDAIKIGMLGDQVTIEAVVEALGLTGGAPVVIDPVMVAESGAVLLEASAQRALRETIMPLATVVTPNLPEACELTGLDQDQPIGDLARAVHALGAKAVVVTGGHTSEGADVFYDGSGDPQLIPGERHPDGAAHGSGCTHSSALAGLIAQGLEPLEAARQARSIAAEAVLWGLRELGAGPGPANVLGTARTDRPG